MLDIIKLILEFLIEYAYNIDLIFVLIIIFFHRKNPESTLLWIMVIMIFHTPGIILYLLIGADYRKAERFVSQEDKEFKYQELVEQQLKELDLNEMPFEDKNYLPYESLIRHNLMNAGAFITNGNTIEIFTDGTKKFYKLIEDIRNAKESIYLEYYIFKADKLGKLILKELTIKASEGLDVKLLVDGMGGRRIRKKDIREFKEAGGSFQVFFPLLFSLLFFRLNYRNHRKIALFDNEIGYVGGFNIGDEYINKSPFGYWNDTHLRITGNGIAGLYQRFYLDWKHATREEIKLPNIKKENNTSKNAGIQIVSSGPDSKWPSNKDAYIRMIGSAKKRIYIKSPYFIPDESVYDAVRLAAISGIDVRIMIPMKRDHPFVYWAGISFLGELLKAGVKVYEYYDGFMHSKCLIVDDFVTSVGTTNMDIRSFILNFEVNAICYDKEVNRILSSQFVGDISKSMELTIEKYEARTLMTKIKESISRLFSPLL
ncbi:MAG: cardiolipin synthase [Tissierellia bacterium]|nr:cardiolipin synthase [Tissierellia bacterium]